MVLRLQSNQVGHSTFLVGEGVMGKTFLIWISLLYVCAFSSAMATTYTVTAVSDPVQNYNNLQNKINVLQPGDVLELAGDATLPFELSHGLVITGCQSAVHVTSCASGQIKTQGTVSSPITIRAASGATPVVIYKGASNNILDIRST